MPSKLCIHGHFYQPPRENPWLGCVFPEPSAAPAPDWNTRIMRESYAPLAFARRMDGQGRIMEIVNCYEWMSFNVGPTLHRWMRLNAPEVLERIIAGDRASVERLGHGNAIAQCYHHIILPLATDEERKLQVSWAVADFLACFGRKPEGMWLSEAAVDTPTLEALAEQDIRFTILAPGQAKAVSSPSEPNSWIPLTEWSLDITKPYRVDLPSGRSIAIFFYDGAISQAVAFERLLSDGESFWRKLSGKAHEKDGLLSLSTDGETYGHHFKFGEMALAHVLSKAHNGDEDVRLTNFSAFLAENPPQQRVVLHEPSSWSCAHGVQRWIGDCGCTNGDHAGWNQKWRTPLRQALRCAKNTVDAHFSATGAQLFRQPQNALNDYGTVLAAPGNAAARTAYVEQHFAPSLNAAEHDTAWQLLAMQELALASFASCAWFFDDISRIEPLNGLTYALRALELAATTGAHIDFSEMLHLLDQAVSNRPEEGTGKDLFIKRIVPRSITPGKLALMALCGVLGSGMATPATTIADQASTCCTYHKNWPDIRVEFTLAEQTQAHAAITGECLIRLPLEKEGHRFSFSWLPPTHPGCAHPLDTSIVLTGMQHEKNGSPAASFIHAYTKDGQCLLGDPCGPGEVVTGRDLPNGARQALVADLLHSASRRALQDARFQTPTLLGLLPPLEKEQHDLTFAPLWADQLEYVVPALLSQPDLLTTAEPYIRAFMSQAECSPRQLERRRAMVSERLLETLNVLPHEPIDWHAMLRKREVLAALMPDADIWAVQNALWMLRSRCMGNPDAARCFEAYGFVPGWK